MATPTPTYSATIGSGLSNGDIGGIVAGVIVVLILVVVALFSYRTRKARRSKTIPERQPLGTNRIEYMGKPEEPLGAPEHSSGHVATGARLSTDLLLSGGENSHELAGINFGS